MQIVANNKKAFFEYFILEKIEAGIQLTGDEVKSLRVGKASIKEAYAEAKKGQLFLVNSDISNYEKASGYSKLNSKRVRKLLVHKKEISKLQGKIEKEGMTIVPLRLYFNNKKGFAYLTFNSLEACEKAIEEVNGHPYDYLILSVKMAEKK